MPYLTENLLRRLSPDELANPKLAVENVFESYHLHEMKDMLAQLQQTMLHALRNKGQREQENWLFFMEKMEKLVEAGWVANRSDGLRLTVSQDETQDHVAK